MATNRTLYTALGVLIASGATFADPIDDFMEEQIAFRRIPGACFAIIENGEIKRIGAYGFANLEHEVKTRVDSVFELASTTKQFTAAAVMLLVEDGKLGLADDITKYVADAPKKWHGITIQHLLTHTAGLPPFFPFQRDPQNPTELTTKQMLDSVSQAELIAKPGERAVYSDPGYFLLGMVIERASGERYADFLQKRIFAPHGMDNSSVLDQWRILKHRVAPYTLRGKHLLRGRRDWQQELPAHYGVWSTVEDVARWVVAIQAGKAVAASSLEKMWTPAKLGGGEDALVWGSQYGFGWMLNDYRGYRIAEHGGFSGTHILVFKNRSLAVVVLTNLDVRSDSEPHAIARGIAGLYDTALALPHTVAQQDDIPSSLAKKMEDVLRSAASGTQTSAATDGYNQQLKMLPPPILDKLRRRLVGMNPLAVLAVEKVDSRGLQRYGDKISHLAYADLSSPTGKWGHTFWLTEGGKIAGMRSYRHP
jgi:CubicO group peptidase (beta-lactamase class C family)